MLFGRKKKEEPKLLYEKNILTGCRADTKEQIIRQLGKMLVDTGYVNPTYVEGMIEREKTFSTFMGNGLALPHGVEEVKKEVLASGIAVMVFPEGTDWGGEKAQLVIGIAGVGDAHLQILGDIAEKVLDEDTMKKMINGTASEVYQILKGGSEGK